MRRNVRAIIRRQDAFNASRRGVRNSIVNGAPSDPYFANVVALFNFNGEAGVTSFVDESVNAVSATTFGNSVLSAAESPFGGTSLRLDGTGDYLSLPHLSDYVIGSQLFTIESWYKSPNGLPTTHVPITMDVGYTFMLYGASTYGRVRAGGWNDSGAFFLNDSYILPGGIMDYSTWNHLCWQGNGTVWRCYLNGVYVRQNNYPQGSFNANNVSNALFIGNSGPSYALMSNAYVGPTRFTMGVNRYAWDGAFDVPTATFPTQ
jgi:hypothetical protein